MRIVSLSPHDWLMKIGSLDTQMRVFDVLDDQGLLRAFEVENAGVGRSGVCRVLKAIPGVTLERTPKLFSWSREDSFCEFKYKGVVFEVEEFFGDNDRYWVGPVPSRSILETVEIRNAFLSFSFPAWWRLRCILGH